MSKKTEPTQQSLLEMESQEIEKPGKALPYRLGKYDRYEVTSALRKEIKLGNIEGAFICVNLLLTHGGKPARNHILKQCWIMCAEDLWDARLSIYTASIIQMEKAVGVMEEDHFYQLVYRMCKATKWWTQEDGRDFDYLWAKSDGIVKNESYQIPPYALDSHTRRGLENQRKTGKLDDRYSGTEIGRQKTKFIFMRDGQIKSDSAIDDDFIHRWSEWQELRGL